MMKRNLELSADELSVATGGGIVDNVLPDIELTTNAFLKRFGEAAASFSTFINPPNAPAANVG